MLATNVLRFLALFFSSTAGPVFADGPEAPGVIKSEISNPELSGHTPPQLQMPAVNKAGPGVNLRQLSDGSVVLGGQEITYTLRPAPPREFPGRVDSNSPAVWLGRRGTDREAGRVARLYIGGLSDVILQLNITPVRTPERSTWTAPLNTFYCRSCCQGDVAGGPNGILIAERLTLAHHLPL